MYDDLEGPWTSSQGGLLGLLATVTRIHAGGDSAVLTIVVSTSGSTYQKPGALVLLDRKGVRHGVISGGCLEPVLEDRARDVLTVRHAAAVEFDTRGDDDLVFGSGTGCQGRVNLLLVPQPPGSPLTCALRCLGEATTPLELAIAASGPDLGSGTAILGDQIWVWGSNGQEIEAFRTEEQSSLTHLRIDYPPRVILLGAGPETPALHAYMAILGWRDCVVEHRGRWLTFARQTGVRDIIELDPDSAAQVWVGQSANAAVVMSHNFSIDCCNLRHCAKSELPYIGLIGPRARRDAILMELGAEATTLLHGRLHAPVGLNLGGAGPEALGLSIVAELQQQFGTRRLQVQASSRNQVLDPTKAWC